MKKVFYIIVALVLLISITACGKKEDITHMGVNAEILEIKSQEKGIVVKGLDDNSMLGEKTYINCEDPDTYFIYVDNNTGEVKDLSFTDLSVGDIITVDIKKVEDNYASTSRVQLLERAK
ncbi:hypothetical protein KQI86_08485 [Clostridium sp. MSJ-11]|uniref:DUF3221 domain-containing protein n=1 Tax=Clostridium mobile TaxID=2841512 RepID=A0ABS6EGQ9_9CLOT|nr:hypothetical protein [Clostridium mobile]MBU5484364.1 hypothetical protein [Clostridium mobile]